MIRLVKVFKTYEGGAGRVQALAGITLDIPPRSFTALMGPSGCGKSTLLNLVAGVDAPSAGEVWVDGRNLAALPDRALSDYRRDFVGIVYQFYNLLPTLAAWENVALPALLAGATGAEARRRAEEQLARVGMLHRAEHWPHELSGGEMQRVALARAMVNRPLLLLADEPTGNLDSAAGRGVLDLLVRLNREQAVTVLLATHSQEAAARADRVVRMRDGSIEDIVMRKT
ncbi:MAG: ABC transporter ATP-binding protein [Candidatus Methylomirabilales bacterium]